MIDFYTPEVVSLIHAAKADLPVDYLLQTRIEHIKEDNGDEHSFIVICIPMENFDSRPVEGPGGKLGIAIRLEQLKQEISKTGIGCVIEKD